MKKAKFGGGWQAIRYTFRKGREVGLLRLWRVMRAKNACKTCALGMGGQKGGMVNEAGGFPEVCKKSLQAMVADMRGRIEPRFFATYSLSELQGFSPRELEMAGRIVEPLVLLPGASHFQPVSWDEAFALVADRFEAADPLRTFFYCSGRSSNEAGFLLQLLARAKGTNHVSNCSYYCHQASGVGLRESVGTPTATISLEDLEKCDLFFLIGGNPASNHPRLMSQLEKLRRRGGKVVVINPVRETGLVQFRVPSNVRSMLLGSEIASHYLQPTIGGDIAVLAGMAKALLAGDAADTHSIEAATEGFAALREFIETLSWEQIEDASGVERRDIEEVAKVYERAERAVFGWTMGITHHEHGVENVQWIANLALMRGMVGKPGAGLLPIRGHSNVQGLGTVGVMPAVREAALRKFHELGIRPPETPGYDTLASLEASHRGEMDYCLALGGNLFGASPDAAYTKEAFANIGTVVYLSTTLNTGHVHGLGQTTLILPVQARDEENQSTTQESMFNFVRLSDGGPARYEGPKAETEVLSAIAARVQLAGKLDWKKLGDHEAIRGLIARLVPGMEKSAEIGKTKEEFDIPGRLIRGQSFPTPTGKAKFAIHPLPKLPQLRPDELRLMTVRSEGQFNTVVYEEEDLYRGQERRDVILMNRKDIERMGFVVDQRVDVEGPGGRIPHVLVREFDIAAGCALMYFPEANVLLSRTADPRSKTPAYKSLVVSVQPSASTANVAWRESPPDRTSMRDHVTASRRNMKSC